MACVLQWAVGQALRRVCSSPATCVCLGQTSWWSWNPGLALPKRPWCLADGALLGARGCPWIKPACHGAAPAAGRHAHAALASLFTVYLALRPLESAGAAGLS